MPEVPEGLGDKALLVWTEITDEYELRADELRILEDACREVDLVERMEEQLAKESLLSTGSMGQTVAHPLVQELRQHRAVIKSLFGALKLPDDDAQPGERSASARKAAAARWGGT